MTETILCSGSSWVDTTSIGPPGALVGAGTRMLSPAPGAEVVLTSQFKKGMKPLFSLQFWVLHQCRVEMCAGNYFSFRWVYLRRSLWLDSIWDYTFLWPCRLSKSDTGSWIFLWFWIWRKKCSWTMFQFCYDSGCGFLKLIACTGHANSCLQTISPLSSCCLLLLSFLEFFIIFHTAIFLKGKQHAFNIE